MHKKGPKIKRLGSRFVYALRSSALLMALRRDVGAVYRLLGGRPAETTVVRAQLPEITRAADIALSRDDVEPPRVTEAKSTTSPLDCDISETFSEDVAMRVMNVVYAYSLLFGRLPESSDAARLHLGWDRLTLTVVLLNSGEFQLGVLGPLLNGRQGWIDGTIADRAAMRWFADTFGLPGLVDAFGQESPTIRRVFKRLFTEEQFLRALDGRLTWNASVLTVADALYAPLGETTDQASTPTHAEAGLEAAVRGWGGFDADWYRSTYRAILAEGVDPVQDYLDSGEVLGRRPNPIFDPTWYRRKYKLDPGVSALGHYLQWFDAYPVSPSPVFDAEFYRRNTPLLPGEEPLVHFRTNGWREGADPNPAFDALWYAAKHDIAAYGDPLTHYMREGARSGAEPHPAFMSSYVRRQAALAGRETHATTALQIYLEQPPTRRPPPSPLFDPEFYRRKFLPAYGSVVDAFWHYHRKGSKEYFDPSPFFCTEDYLEKNDDVRRAGMSALAHFMSAGAQEGRVFNVLFDAKWYASSQGREMSTLEALEDFFSVGWANGLSPSPFFEVAYYLQQDIEAASTGRNPIVAYIEHGWRNGFNPNYMFDVKWYAQKYDLQDQDPLSHYIQHEISDGLDPGPDFSVKWYAERYLGGLTQGHSPLADFLHTGRSRGWSSSPRALVDWFRKTTAENSLKPYDSWLDVNPENLGAEADLLTTLGTLALEKQIKISVLMPCFNSDPVLLSAAIDSLRGQIYENWELCACDDASTEPATQEVLKSYAKIDPRVLWVSVGKNLNISGATNTSAEMATGEVFVLLDHDDILSPTALAELTLAYAKSREVDIVYTDDDKIDQAGDRYAPQFKPSWSPILLLSFMYMSHVFSFRRELFDAVGGFRPEFDGAQDFDFALRISERAREVIHIPRVLYHWRAVSGSTALSAEAKPEAFERGRLAVQAAFDRRGLAATVVHPLYARDAKIGLFEPKFHDDGPMVTIIVPTRNRMDLVKVCLESLKKTTYKNYNLLIIDNDSDDYDTIAYLKKCPARVIRVSSLSGKFNFSHLINCGVEACESDFVLFLNNDTEIKSPNWLSQMMGYAQMPSVGAVGARLLYADERVQHAGIVHGLHEGMAGHAFKLTPGFDHGYLGLARASREVAGVTAACMLMSKKLFIDLGGMDERNFAVAYNDVDLSYRIVDAGYSCVYCGSAEVFHYEGKSRGFGDNPSEEAAMRRKYGLRRDPWYNPNLSLTNEKFEVARTHVALPRTRPVQAAFVSHNFNHEGAPNSLFELCAGLKGEGRVDPIVLSPTEGPLRERYIDVGIGAYVIDHPLLHWPDEDVFEANLRRLGQSFLYAGVEVVVANTADAFWAVEAANRVGLPAIWIIRESEDWADYFIHFPAHIAQTAYAAFDHCYRIVFVARATLEAWKPLNRRGAFTLIRNGLNTERLDESLTSLDRASTRRILEVPPDTVVFTCVGTVAERKGQIDLIRAFAELSETSAARAMVVLVGDRPSEYSSRLHEEVNHLSPDRRARVRIVPETSRARSYLTGSDVFVCCSRVESYPRVTLEAMAAGLPLITTPVWGIREQVRPDYNARLYEPGDALELARYMSEMIEQPELRATFGRRSRPVFDSLPDFQQMRDEYTRVIEQAPGSI